VVVKLLNEYSSLSYKLNESSEKETKEKDGYVHGGNRWKRNQDWDLVFTRKGKKT